MSYGIDRGFGYKDSPRPSTVCDVAEEVVRAREKFPRPNHLVVALAEEIGELAKACLQYGPTSDPARREAMQVAAVAIRIMEEGDPTLEELDDSARKP